MRFCENLKRFRKLKGITQAALAEILKVSQSTVGNWEAGSREPDLQTIIKISTLFSIPVDDLLGVQQNEKECNSRWERAMEQYADMTPDEQRRIDAVLDAFFPDDTQPPGIIRETTVGAEQDRRAADDAEAEEIAG